MDFYEVLDDVLELLRRRGRVTYRALKVQFQLDDEQVAALKEEIIYAHESSVQADDRGFTWTGKTDEIPVTTSQPDQPEPQPVVEQAQPIQEISSPVATHTPDAERRQLTVMFVDLVGSTSLSGELDPEDLRDVVRAYHSACTDVITRYNGHVAQHLGDGLLVYFGYPQAHEDDPQRAVHTGLGITTSLKMLNARLEADTGIQLSIRMGIHTGLVVIGEMGSGERQEQLALGETPNIAARIQGLAEPDTIIISDATYRLIQGYFDCEALGEHDLRGISQPIVVYRVLQESGVQSRLDIASLRGLTPLVGRESECALLFEGWEQVKDGNGQVILLSGEAGIGKSRLVQVLKDHIADEPHTRLECRSSPYFTNSALYPMTDFLQRTLRFQANDTSEQKLEKLIQNLSHYRLPLEESVPLFSTLLSLPLPEDPYPPLNLTPQRQRQKTLEAILAIILELSERQPVLFILEDLHWSDPTTLEFIELLIDQIPTASIDALLTCRPEFQPSWSHRSYLAEVMVNRLSQPQIARMAEQVVGAKHLPDEIVQQLMDKTDGVPLYVEEMTKAVLESGVLKETNSHYELAGSMTSLSIPATLQDSLMARLDRLVTAKVIAQSASVIGREFSYVLLQAVSELDEATLQRELGRLVESELVYQHGIPPQAVYTFKHALIQDTAYQSLLRSTRQQHHQRIAQVLEAQFPETVAMQPELVAQHYTAAGCAEQAVVYWQRSGQQASERSANVEAISHFTTGIELLKTLPETPEYTQEALALYIGLGTALRMTKGQAAPEVGHAYNQAYALCQQAGETPQLAQALLGLWFFYTSRAQLHTARELGETLLRLAQRTHDPALAVLAHYALGATWFYLGAFPAARQHLEAAIAQEPGGFWHLYAATALWFLGYLEQAVARLHEALALVHEVTVIPRSQSYSLAYAAVWAALANQLRRDVPAVYEQAEVAVALTTEHGFPMWGAMGTSLRGWARAMQGQGEEGLAQIRQGIAAVSATGAAVFIPYLCTLVADVADHLGRTEDALQALAEAHTLVEQQEERWWEAEVCRLRGVLLLRQPGTSQADAETWLQRALDVARRQEAKSLELRAASSLTRLWQSQGKRDEARELLEPVYNWFTEGFDTADLIDAKALLDELS